MNKNKQVFIINFKKISVIMLLLVGVITFSSCSNDDDTGYGTTNATTSVLEAGTGTWGNASDTGLTEIYFYDNGSCEVYDWVSKYNLSSTYTYNYTIKGKTITLTSKEGLSDLTFNVSYQTMEDEVPELVISGSTQTTIVPNGLYPQSSTGL